MHPLNSSSNIIEHSENYWNTKRFINEIANEYSKSASPTTRHQPLPEDPALESAKKRIAAILKKERPIGTRFLPENQ